MDLDFIDNGVSEIADSMGFESDDVSHNESELEHTEESEEVVDSGESEEDETKADPAEEIEQVKTERTQPTSWAKDKAELWSKTPDDVKDYIEQRESQMLEGINQYRDGYKYGEYISQAIEPYRAEIEAGGGDEATAIMNLFEHHRAITQGALEQRQQAFIKIGIATGLIPQEGQPDPKVSQLEQRISAFERQQQQAAQRQQQETYSSVQKQVDEFSKTHEHFDLLANEISALLPTVGNDLQKAYDKAVWLNDVTRQKEVDRIANEKAKARQDEALKAKKAASVNIRPAQVKTRIVEPKGRLFDDSDLSNTLAEIRARA